MKVYGLMRVLRAGITIPPIHQPRNSNNRCKICVVATSRDEDQK